MLYLELPSGIFGEPAEVHGALHGNDWGAGTSGSSPRTADLGYTYDAMGRVLKTRQCVPGSCPGTTYEQDYSYDLLGDTTSATDGVGDTMGWTYNRGPAVTAVQASFSTNPLMSGIQYGPFGMTSVTLGNGHTEVDGYDGRGRLQTIAYNNSLSQPVYSVALTRAPDSSITTANDSVNGSWNYSYDGFNRLTSATATSGSYSGATLSWTYDRYGNRLTQGASGTNSTPVIQSTYSFGSHQVVGFCYDSAGNLLDQTTCPGSGSTHQYKYDAEGRLIATAGTTYEYDAGGARRSKDSSSGTPTTLFLHDGSGNQIAELSAALVVQHVNVYSGQHLIGTLNKANGTIYYAYSDWLGTKRYEADGSGTYVNSWTSLPFGDNETALGSGLDATEHHFTGKEHDAESGLDYFQARYYQSQTGRWLLPDWSETPVPVPYPTFTNPQSLNLYTYVGNNPVNVIDADGHAFENGQDGSTRTGLGVTDPAGCGNINADKVSEPDSVCVVVQDGAVTTGNAEAQSASQDQLAQQQNLMGEIRNVPTKIDYSQWTSPTGSADRGCDAGGCGNFGASRKEGLGTEHNGTDYLGTVGQPVVAVHAGTVKGIGYAYSGDTTLRAIEFKSALGFSFKELYVQPLPTIKSGVLVVECPATFVPVSMRQTGMRGVWNGTRKEAHTGANRNAASAG